MTAIITRSTRRKHCVDSINSGNNYITGKVILIPSLYQTCIINRKCHHFYYPNLKNAFERIYFSKSLSSIISWLHPITKEVLISRTTLKFELTLQIMFLFVFEKKTKGQDDVKYSCSYSSLTMRTLGSDMPETGNHLTKESSSILNPGF